MSGSDLTFGQDPREAAWLAARLTGTMGHVSGVVPAGFAAYARVLHPVARRDQHVSWSEVAQAAGTQVHALAQWHRVAPRRKGVRTWWREAAPDIGNLAPDTLADLVDVLGRHTTAAADCWFCLWSGYGWIHGGPAVGLLGFDEDAGREEAFTKPPAFPDDVRAHDRLVQLPNREYLLARGPLQGASQIGDQVSPDWFMPQSPNLFWPNDRTWCVATEIDFDSTLVGGTEELITELINHDRLEVHRVQPHDSLQDNADRDN